MDKKTTWQDIENSLKNSVQNSPEETDPEKLAYFKNKILAHLDNLQAEEDKKIIPFPKGKK
jgi:gas vesicle protein